MIRLIVPTATTARSGSGRWLVCLFLALPLALSSCGTEEEDPGDDAGTDSGTDVVPDDDVTTDADGSADPPIDVAIDLRWFQTCGDPVCREDGHRPSGLPQCTTEILGDPCSEIDASCDPVDPCNAHYVCATEDPRLGEVGCPISLRTFKRDIHYVTDDERALLARHALSVPITTWRYVQQPDAVRLGFLIDDIAPSPMIAPSGDQVDLYAYTTALLAVVQLQQEQIASLAARLEALEQRASAGD
jgi:hypothetical protein